MERADPWFHRFGLIQLSHKSWSPNFSRGHHVVFHMCSAYLIIRILSSILRIFFENHPSENNIGCFLKTRVPSFFKLCMIINFHEDYKCTSFWWPLTFTQDHRISRKVNAHSTVEWESYEHLLFLFTMSLISIHHSENPAFSQWSHPFTGPSLYTEQIWSTFIFKILPFCLKYFVHTLLQI